MLQCVAMGGMASSIEEASLVQLLTLTNVGVVSNLGVLSRIAIVVSETFSVAICGMRDCDCISYGWC